jgi:hypothetical protein
MWHKGIRHSNSLLLHAQQPASREVDKLVEVLHGVGGRGDLDCANVVSTLCKFSMIVDRDRQSHLQLSWQAVLHTEQMKVHYRQNVLRGFV